MNSLTSNRLIPAGLALLALASHHLPAAQSPSTWQSVECIPADRSPAELYMVVQPVDHFEGDSVRWGVAVGGQHARATLHRDTGERHQGEAALRVDYDFMGKKDYEYIQLNGAADFPNPGLGFGFWLKHDGTPFPLRGWLGFVDPLDRGRLPLRHTVRHTERRVGPHGQRFGLVPIQRDLREFFNGLLGCE